MIIGAPSRSWIIAANVLLGVNQGLAWSMTVIMKRPSYCQSASDRPAKPDRRPILNATKPKGFRRRYTRFAVSFINVMREALTWITLSSSRTFR
jgi:hypothetical protein